MGRHETASGDSSLTPLVSRKYPKTPHLPWSPGAETDDFVLDRVPFLGSETVVTEKMDGGNVCLTRHGVFSRSHSGPPTLPSFDLLKGLHAVLKNRIPDGLSVFCEWCFAVISIRYSGGLPHVLFPFAVRDDRAGRWKDWKEVEDLAKILSLPTVPVLVPSCRVSSDSSLRKILDPLTEGPSRFGPEREGIVVRTVKGWDDTDFGIRIAKWVRANHVRTDNRWRHGTVERQQILPGTELFPAW